MPDVNLQANAPLTADALDQTERRLAEIVGAGFVARDAATLAAYANDATPLLRGRPEIVCSPASTAEVSAVVALAAELHVPLVTRGAGTNLCGATVAQHGGIVLAVTRMKRILEVDAANMAIVCQPGVTTVEVADAAASGGLLYPPDPGSRTASTIGGNVATCAGGLRGLKYGVTRDYVLGCEVVIGTGEVIRWGGKTVKDVAGFDLARLMCGSEGTLGVITEVTLRLVPTPPATGTGHAYFPTLEEAGEAVSAVLARGVLPATLEFLDRVCIETVEDYAHIGLRTDAGALLVFGQDGSSADVAADMLRIAETCREAGAIEVTIASSSEEAARLLEARRAALPALSRRAPVTVLEDASVPRSKVPEMVRRLEEIAHMHGLVIGTFGHAGDGNLHPTCVFDPEEPGIVERVERAFADVFAAALDLGGTISGEHGIGIVKLPYLERQLGSAQIALLRRIKEAFDPAGILNPGKLGS
ncbi:MAG TPA: FAD-linked oxidase C-terminal domain-containing protein [Solirubrobacteraceae bacterium]|jgi:glycolate oxidase|nr:FAD-linked oxidase C-terminal domain-containing protein [Solirubrobacteraceae bacterium]